MDKLFSNHIIFENDQIREKKIMSVIATVGLVILNLLNIAMITGFITPLVGIEIEVLYFIMLSVILIPFEISWTFISQNCRM